MHPASLYAAILPLGKKWRHRVQLQVAQKSWLSLFTRLERLGHSPTRGFLIRVAEQISVPPAADGHPRVRVLACVTGRVLPVVSLTVDGANAGSSMTAFLFNSCLLTGGAPEFNTHKVSAFCSSVDKRNG